MANYKVLKLLHPSAHKIACGWFICSLLIPVLEVHRVIHHCPDHSSTFGWCNSKL